MSPRERLWATRHSCHVRTGTSGCRARRHRRSGWQGFRAFSASPTLVYFYRSESDALGLDHLREMSDQGLLVLREVATGGSSARNMEPLTSALTPGSHVAVCGPRQLVVKVLTLSRKAKTFAVSFETFDYRSPFGPDLNPLLKSLVRFILPRALFLKLGWLFEKDARLVARS